ncbi:diguanylate cyclase [Sulfurimonas sp.]|uniref:GGDEF domain-containing response regulator n=1 Tax=Sulfurimonas sp. TaxID=2022749 RepID=UPI003569F5E9
MKKDSFDVTILYVEDEIDIRESLGKFLKRFTDKLYIAKNGKEGLELYKKHKPDIVISDIKMPIMNGIEMLKAINEINPDQPSIFTTAHSESGFFMEAIEMQVDGYILKPINLKLLKSKIESLANIIQLKRDFQKQQLLIQEVSSLQDNLLILLDVDEKLIFSNQEFLKFFAFSDIDEFNEKYNSISELFVESKTFFCSTCKWWIEELESRSDDKRVVSMLERSTGISKSFVVYVKRVPETRHTIVTFSEITNLASKKNEFETKAYKDELTGIGNRAKFNEELLIEIEKSTEETPLSLIIFDIDYFKNFNDEYGHQAGDEILKELALLVSKNIRKVDVFARWGGEEFVILLANTDKVQAKKTAEYLRVKVEKHVFENNMRVTCSFGVTQFMNDDTANSFFKRGDEALYRAKSANRNIVME